MKRFWKIQTVSSLLLFLLIAFLLRACGGSAVPPGPPLEVPSVINANMLDGEVSVPVDASFVYDFGEPVDATTVTDESFFLVEVPEASASLSKGLVKAAFDAEICEAANALPATITCETVSTCTLEPTNDLVPVREHALCLTGDIRLASSAAIDAVAILFTTEEAGPLELSSLEGKTGVPIESTFRYFFPGASGTWILNPQTVTANTYFIVPLPAGQSLLSKAVLDPAICDPADQLAATRTTTKWKMTLDPDAPLEYLSEYVICAMPGIGVQDNSAAGDVLPSGEPDAFEGFMAPFRTERGLTIPTLAAVRAAIADQNAAGFVTGLPLGAITLPVCTMAGGGTPDFDVSYSLEGLPSWLRFDAATREVLLKDTVIVTEGAKQPLLVTYHCEDQADPNEFDELTFVLNDLDDGGVVDAWEYSYGAVPLVDNNRYIQLNPGNVDLYRVASANGYLIPTNLVLPQSGMDPLDPVDDTADFDNDAGVVGGGTNAEEIANGTNPFIKKTSGTSWSTPSSYPVDATAAVYRPEALAAGDINGDGVLDIVTANTGDASISVLLGDGSGGFGGPTRYAVGADPLGLRIGDLNGDGAMDVAVTDSSDNDLTIFLNNGIGVLSEASERPTAGNAPFGIVLGDYNADGVLDFVVADAEGDTVSQRFGLNNGEFQSPLQTENVAFASVPNYVTAADLNDDGALDIVTSNYGSNDISVLLGDGAGDYGPHNEFATDTETNGLASVDLDKDGDIDIVTANKFSETLTALFNAGNGTYGSRTPYTLQQTVEAYGLIATDLDGDTNIDIAVANSSFGNLYFFVGDADGIFTEGAVRTTPAAVTVDPIAGDFDGDGDLDIACVNPDGDSIIITLNQ